MLKLYKKVNGSLRYHEAWCDKSKITEHWGVVGTRGKSKEHKKPRGKVEEAAVMEVLKAPLSKGYLPINDDDIVIMLIEFPIDGKRTSVKKDLDKRHALEDRMNETLGWTGLGHCDGGSIGSGTMEVCCMVVDAKKAKQVIAADLKGTKFADYSRIYKE